MICAAPDSVLDRHDIHIVGHLVCPTFRCCSSDGRYVFSQLLVVPPHFQQKSNESFGEDNIYRMRTSSFCLAFGDLIC
jgi:hypothetical protein